MRSSCKQFSPRRILLLAKRIDMFQLLRFNDFVGDETVNCKTNKFKNSKQSIFPIYIAFRLRYMKNDLWPPVNILFNFEDTLALNETGINMTSKPIEWPSMILNPSQEWFWGNGFASFRRLARLWSLKSIYSIPKCKCLLHSYMQRKQSSKRSQSIFSFPLTSPSPNPSLLSTKKRQTII